ncbi:MAG TPA: hypothetical protein VM716_02565 [Gemmatimonadales bacterium]|nr:hypothetical protein [Gemmatimonadales bacterium]
MASEVVCIKTFANRPEAELAKTVLEANGIPAIVSVDDVGGMRPEVAFGKGARLLVDANQVQGALELLAVDERPGSRFERAALNSKLRGCMLPALLGLAALGLGAALTDYVVWLGRAVVLSGLALLVLAVVRGARAA